MAENPDNIRLVSIAEHNRIHTQGTRVPTRGPLLDRMGALRLRIPTGGVGALRAISPITMVTGILSWRIRTDNLDNMVSDYLGIESSEDVRLRNIDSCGTPEGCI